MTIHTQDIRHKRLGVFQRLDLVLDAVFGTVDAIPTLAHGTWTPTASLITNLDAAIPQQGRYLRVGNTVHFSGETTVDATATGLWQLDLTIPVASNFSANAQLSGIASIAGGSDQARLIAQTTNDRISMIGVASVTGSLTYAYLGSYAVI